MLQTEGTVAAAAPPMCREGNTMTYAIVLLISVLACGWITGACIEMLLELDEIRQSPR